jgi:hypothetical protein
MPGHCAAVSAWPLRGGACLAAAQLCLPGRCRGGPVPGQIRGVTFRARPGIISEC